MEIVGREKWSGLIVAALILANSITNGVLAMGLSDVGKVCLFSKMEGVIKLDGKPVSSARLVRTVNLSKDEVDETVTDENGYFKFDVIFKRTITKLLPQEFVSNQNVTVYLKDKKYRIWSSVKRVPDENSESRGKPFVVECELNSEERILTVNNSPIFTLCTWDVVPDEKPDMSKLMDLINN